MFSHKINPYLIDSADGTGALPSSLVNIAETQTKYNYF